MKKIVLQNAPEIKTKVLQKVTFADTECLFVEAGTQYILVTVKDNNQSTIYADYKTQDGFKNCLKEFYNLRNYVRKSKGL